eukprot:15411554-Heterocapsa_arctica.AAC.1
MPPADLGLRTDLRLRVLVEQVDLGRDLQVQEVHDHEDPGYHSPLLEVVLHVARAARPGAEVAEPDQQDGWRPAGAAHADLDSRRLRTWVVRLGLDVLEGALLEGREPVVAKQPTSLRDPGNLRGD